jgi:hypothetical protein
MKRKLDGGAGEERVVHLGTGREAHDLQEASIFISLFVEGNQLLQVINLDKRMHPRLLAITYLGIPPQEKVY